MTKKRSLILAALLSVGVLHAGKGKIRVAADQQGAYIYVDGKKKAMTGEGFTSILLEEGDHIIRVIKPIDKSYEYVQSKNVFVGEDTSAKLKFKLKKQMNSKGKALQAKKDEKKLARWQRTGSVVVDVELGLLWQDNAAAKSTKKKWKSAKRHCRNLKLDGYSDWRLPTYDELLTIVDYDRCNPAIMPRFENTASSFYWSSSVGVSDAEGAWGVRFKCGDTYTGFQSYGSYVRCVRTR